MVDEKVEGGEAIGGVGGEGKDSRSRESLKLSFPSISSSSSK